MLGKILNYSVVGNLISETRPQAVDESQAMVEATVMHSGNIVGVDSVVDSNAVVGLILDKTPFYSPEGGQGSDVGKIRVKNLTLNVTEVRKICNYVIHVGKFVVQDGR